MDENMRYWAKKAIEGQKAYEEAYERAFKAKGLKVRYPHIDPETYGK